jgi:hypothetical protein
MVATQRGRRSWLHESLTKPKTKSAVDLGSMVTFSSFGGGGTGTADHWSMMLCADARAATVASTEASMTAHISLGRRGR